MAFTFQQLKQAKQNIMDSFGLSAPDASRVVGFFSGSPDTVQAIINNDLAGVPSALSALGLAPQGTAQDQTQDQRKPVQDQEKPQGAARKAPQETAPVPQCAQDQGEPRKQGVQDQGKKDQRKKLDSRMTPAGGTRSRRKRSASSAPIAANAPQECAPAMAPDVPQGAALDCPPADDPHALPAGLYDEICSTIDFYCQQNDIKEPRKMHPHEWKSLCIYIGQGIKARKLLQDTTRLREGGFRYDPQKLLALLNIYDYTCGQYKQVPFEHNFARFAGVSLDYLKDYMQKGLTSAHVGLAQKAHDIQTAGLIDGASGGGSASVPLIFLCKALGGLSETVTVQHVTSAAAPQVSALPVFDDGGSLLPDDGGEK